MSPKPIIRRVMGIGLAAGLALSCGLAQAAWQLDPDQSRVTATVTEITSGGESITHKHALRRMEGQISADGTLKLPIRLNQTDVLDRLGDLPPWMSSLTNTTLVTVVTHLPPERINSLAVGQSTVEILTLRTDANGEQRQEKLPVRFTREADDVVRVRNAEPVSLDGRELMKNQTVRSILSLMGYQQIGDEVPVELDAVLVDR
ncbi:hypothetical protein [uncultured Salinicola sp.]|uniref:hypothetical protein n=1 Tax=uncultured Salinicola sp. TaxID=1193542 RepID=UPI0026106FC9|nr:hypothetical protein [uncultured Salinicola sp.]|tara:strand:+ start:59 stop:667 length:609 start_codon:yes stop_codon:yes gene_type:complete